MLALGYAFGVAVAVSHPSEVELDRAEGRRSEHVTVQRDLGDRRAIRLEQRSGDLAIGASIPLAKHSDTSLEWTVGADAGAAPMVLEAGATYLRWKPLIGLCHQRTAELAIFGGVGAGPAWVTPLQTQSGVEATASSRIGFRAEGSGAPVVVQLGVDGVMHHGASASLELAIVNR